MITTIQQCLDLGGPTTTVIARISAVLTHGPQDYDEEGMDRMSCPMCGFSGGNNVPHFGQLFHTTCQYLFEQDMDAFRHRRPPGSMT